MSIVALKRKTEAKYNNNSVNQLSGFSLNGTHRNQGYIGQTSLSRSLSRTLMKGTAVKGHGGCCGTYTYGPVVRSASSLCLEDSSVVKGSVLSSKGMLQERFACDDNCNVVKPDSNNNLNSHSDVIRRRAKACINASDSNYQPKMPSNTTNTKTIYTSSSGGWLLKGSQINGLTSRENSGRSVSMNSDGTIVAIGSWLNDEAFNNAGTTRIYKWNGTAWTLQKQIDGLTAGELSGHSVSINNDGTAVAIGAYSFDGGVGPDSGTTRIYSIQDITTATTVVESKSEFCKNECVNYAKPESTFVAMPGSEYLRKINKRCSENDVKYVASNVKRTPFGSSS